MTRLQLLDALRKLDQQGHWLINRRQIRLLFRGESEGAQNKALRAHVRDRLLTHVAQGLYANPASTVTVADPLMSVAQHLRPTAPSYVSLEFALHARGALSQVPSTLTIMTAGRSRRFVTPFGAVEFVHTNRDPSTFPGDPDANLPLADTETALRDMRRCGRHLGFEPGSLDDAIAASA